ncbi:MAG TPA: ATP-binding protein, partial [Myxococcales bacterium]
TPLGPISRWPQSLRITVSTCLNSRFPILVWWGPEMVKLYNDANRVILGSKHPHALGAKGREVWPEIWNIIGPMLEGVLQRGEATWSEDILLPLERKGFPEECYFTFSYSPIRDESGGVGGIFTAVTETTQRVLGDRRLRTLRELASATLETRTAEAVCAAAVATLSRNSDLPFLALYLREGERTRCMGVAGLADSSSREEAWRVEEAARTGRPISLEELEEVASSGAVIRRAITLPVMRPGEERAAAVLVAGLSPLLALDEAYAGFLDLVAGQIAAAISAARAHEAERKRAEALAELDRAKTAFFSNVSHEFRTPLTLILGPVEDALRSPAGALCGEALEALYRNSLRLLKLVNALLDFSRIEAGASSAVYQPTDAAHLTAELAGAFRAAVERASLRFEIDCPDLPEPLFIDHDLWEKLVLNLLSNALKFTFQGSIRLGLRWVGRGAELTVEDTGTGIAEEELPRIFDRFHRVAGARARTHEGTGIGLTLVQEIARVHGGSVRVESRPAQGTTFRVFVPRGHEHLPREHVRATLPGDSAVTGAAPFVEEALRWLPGDGGQGAAAEGGRPGDAAEAGSERILVADDNADMRDYLCRLLSERWQVRAVADGEAALALARSERPDLVVADVMMPGLDGFELLRALRADPATRGIPLIMLSARAGEEARIEGIEAGADDYLVKPFSARELIARVSAHLTIGRLRAEASRERERLSELFQQVPIGVALLEGPEHLHTVANPSYCAMLGRSEVLGRTVREVFPELGDHEIVEAMDRVYRTGEPVRSAEMHARIRRRGADLEDAWFSFVTHPLRGAGGAVTGVMLVAADVTGQVLARRRLEDLRAAAESASAAKDEFLAMLGHELRNPLAPIATALHLMKLRAGGALEKERAVIERQTAHLTRLVDDLLDVSRITRGKVELRRRRVEASEVVARAIEMVSPLLEERQHRLTIAVPSRGLVVDADPARLSQVVANLLTNAAKYTEQGGHIQLAAWVEGDELRIEVRDDGVGIAPDILPRMFEPFLTTKESGHGVGLGLAVSRSIIERQTAHLTRLVDDLLDVSRITRGKVELRRRRLEVSEAVSRAIEMVSPLLEERQHRVTIAVPSRGLLVDADPARLSQVVENLLTNAAKYTDPGGSIEIAAARSDGGVRISV